jgi:hypothetical protein
MLFKTKTYTIDHNEMLNTYSFGKLNDTWLIIEDFNQFKAKGKVKDFFDERLLDNTPPEIKDFFDERLLDNTPPEILDWHCILLCERGVNGDSNDFYTIILEPDLDACIKRINDYLYPPVEDGDKVRLN